MIEGLANMIHEKTERDDETDRIRTNIGTSESIKESGNRVVYPVDETLNYDSTKQRVHWCQIAILQKSKLKIPKGRLYLALVTIADYIGLIANSIVLLLTYEIAFS